MAAHILPQDVTEHLEAAIQLSNRRVHLRFLDEAEVLISLNLPSAAVLICGVVLESIFSDVSGQVTPEDRPHFEKWFELRNSVAHEAAPAVSLDQAREMLEGVRTSLTRDLKVGPRLVPLKTSPEASEQLRGKYKFVPTSSGEFIRRKAEELRLEHDERRI